MLFTPMMYHAGMSRETREARRNRSLLRTEGNAWDCAAAVRFLASDEARWITGTILTVRSLSPRPEVDPSPSSAANLGQVDAGATAAASVVME